MDKDIFLRRLSRAFGVPLSTVESIWNSVLQSFRDALCDGEPVIVPGLGVFSLRYYPPAVQPSSFTGETVECRERTSLYFYPTTELKEALKVVGPISLDRIPDVGIGNIPSLIERLGELD